MDDALAQRLGFATLDALRESIRAKKAASHEANADRLAEAALLDLAGANLTVELPAAVLDQNADHALQQLKDKLSRSRFSLELYCQANNTTPEQLRAGYRQDAARRMRAMLAVPAIAQAENITVSNEEVDAEYARLARLHGNPEEEIRRVLARDAVAAALTNQKVQRFLLDRHGADYEAIFSNPYYLEITRKGSTKGGMVAELARLLGIAPEHIYCVGDNQNDIPMLAVSAIPFAPANCAPEVKQCSWGLIAWNPSATRRCRRVR